MNGLYALVRKSLIPMSLRTCNEPQSVIPRPPAVSVATLELGLNEQFGQCGWVRGLLAENAMRAQSVMWVGPQRSVAKEGSSCNVMLYFNPGNVCFVASG